MMDRSEERGSYVNICVDVLNNQVNQKAPMVMVAGEAASSPVLTH